MNTDFHSILDEDMMSYIKYKRALGRKYLTEEKALGLFDRYLVEHSMNDISDIHSEFIETFLTSRPRKQPRSYNHLLGVISCFFNWLIQQERLQGSPVKSLSRRKSTLPRPFLFKPEQIKKVMQLAGQLPDNSKAVNRSSTYTLIFSLMYGLGLRVGEVVKLQYADINFDRQYLEIKKSKFGKTRLVPFGPNIGSKITNYLRSYTSNGLHQNTQTPVFSFTSNHDGQARPICIETISQVFHHIMVKLNFNIPPGTRPPHLHCLRHSFAVETLLRWYRQGIDPSGRLFHLATFMGHVDPLSTAWYLTITDELLQEANSRFESFANKADKENEV